MKARFVYRSAITGRFVSRAYAKRWPRLTIRQRLVEHPHFTTFY